MKVASPVIEAHEFSSRDIIGGDPALDFVNTVTGRDETPRDWLDGYPRLLDWAALVKLLPERNLRALARRAQREPRAAAIALARAKAFREELFALLTRIVSGDPPPRGALALLREQWIRGTAAHELAFHDGHIVSELRNDGAGFDLVAATIGYRMVEHVLTVPAVRLRICDGSNCSWLFIDASKAGRRRWCDMAVCGNVAKSQRFYARTRRGRHLRT